MKLKVVLIVGLCLATATRASYIESFREDIEIFYKSVQEKNVKKFEKDTVANQQKSLYPFQDPSLPLDKRVDDLISRLTLDEVWPQLAMGGAFDDGPAPAIPRFNIKPYQWNTECLRGYAFHGDATCFPSPIGLASTFDPDLVQSMARAIAYEARAKHNAFMASGTYDDHTGMSCFSPMINIMRHPLWGRNQETYGEDPFMTGKFAEHYVRGLQGDNDRYALASAVCKHLAGHGGPEDHPNRFGFNAVISDHDLHMTHLPAFRGCMKAKPYGVMCSYNAINGIPSCANKKLLSDILRGELGFTGYITSDEGAIDHIDDVFHYTKTPLDTAVAAITAGVSLSVSDYKTKARYLLLKEAVQKGRITEDLLRERLKPLFYTRFALGEFDPPSMNPFSNISIDVVQSTEHRELARTITSKTFTLLKNRNSVLPLKQMFKKAAIVGPFTLNSVALTGDYFTQYPAGRFSTVNDGAKKMASKTVVVKGCVGKWDVNLPRCANYSEDEVKSNVPGSDLVLITVGTGTGVETETLDRTTLALPGKQLDMVKSVVKYADPKAKIILLLFNAGPLDVSWALASPRIDAILACYFPAQSAGEAIYRVLVGIENPAARLPSTWPASLDQVLPITNYTMHERTYRYSTTKPLFPFGYGLSYTTFEYSNLRLASSIYGPCDPVAISVTVKNTGARSGEEVVQVYISWKDATVRTANLQLVNFKRTNIRAGESRDLYFVITPEQRAVWNNDLMLEPGKMVVYVGGQQPNQEVKVPSNVLESEFAIQGSTIPLRKCSDKSE